jgi:hypothetical protein
MIAIYKIPSPRAEKGKRDTPKGKRKKGPKSKN